LALENSFAFLALSWLFYMLKLSARKLHIILFLNHFPLRGMFIWPVTFGSTFAAKSLNKKAATGKSAEHGGHVTRGYRRSSLSRTYEVFGCDF
jgi:hypothetical protein